MAKYFHERRNTVIICGRSENRLTQATKELQVIHTIKCDVADFGDRKTLFLYVSGNFPNINILINNAGIQRDIDLTKGISDLSCDLNVLSGLAFMVERAIGMPVYCATKAGLHAFSIAQRKQLAPLTKAVFPVKPSSIVCRSSFFYIRRVVPEIRVSFIQPVLPRGIEYIHVQRVF